MVRDRVLGALGAGLLVSLPATARADSFDALADFLLWVGLLSIFVLVLAGVTGVALVAGRRRAPRRRWKARFGRWGVLAVLVATGAMFAATVLIAAQHGPLTEALALALVTLAPPVPAVGALYRLGRRNAVKEEEGWADEER